MSLYYQHLGYATPSGGVPAADVVFLPSLPATVVAVNGAAGQPQDADAQRVGERPGLLQRWSVGGGHWRAGKSSDRLFLVIYGGPYGIDSCAPLACSAVTGVRVACWTSTSRITNYR